MLIPTFLMILSFYLFAFLLCSSMVCTVKSVYPLDVQVSSIRIYAFHCALGNHRWRKEEKQTGRMTESSKRMAIGISSRGLAVFDSIAEDHIRDEFSYDGR